jgi:CheY-like chemotaxis protein
MADQGYDVATAENGRQALEMVGAEPFAVVLLNILMPEMDGYKTLASTKAGLYGRERLGQKSGFRQARRHQQRAW